MARDPLNEAMGSVTLNCAVCILCMQRKTFVIGFWPILGSVPPRVPSTCAMRKGCAWNIRCKPGLEHFRCCRALLIWDKHCRGVGPRIWVQRCGLAGTTSVTDLGTDISRAFRSRENSRIG